ncbi:sensor histidine kinase [Candidatus Poriferisodalis sp.]|uniref:sensor histidine kinase n=1 Tax=Candidatus Poriferisodalis sp. TaxID=3101277 RepID=UPI003B59A33D
MIAALVAVAAALAVALVAVLLLVRGRSSASERLGRVVHRFAGEGEAPRPGEARLDRNSLDGWITYLESVATTAAMTANLAERDRARWQLAMNELAVGVVLVDEDGNVCASNALADEMMSARDAMALVGAGVTQLLESAQEGQARSRTVKLTGPPPQVIEISGHPVASDSHALGAVAVMADRTDGVRVDEVRRDFVANLSHELRTPVGAIALLSETLAGEDDAAVRTRLVDRIGAEADRVRHIIDDLLELSRVELEGSMRQEPVPVVPLLCEVAHQYSEHARKNDVSLVSPDVAEQQPVLHADRGQLLRAVGNLVDNAIKYSDPGSEVRLSAALGSQDDRPPSEVPADADEQAWVDVVVADEGIGIPADETERVFERFYRVDKARARATGGTGLGLSIVRHVVMNHGGEVMLQTREGVGTTFTLRLPAEQDRAIT